MRPPHLSVEQTLEPVLCAFQQQAPDEEAEENDIGEGDRHVQHLRGEGVVSQSKGHRQIATGATHGGPTHTRGRRFLGGSRVGQSPCRRAGWRLTLPVDRSPLIMEMQMMAQVRKSDMLRCMTGRPAGWISLDAFSIFRYQK